MFFFFIIIHSEAHIRLNGVLILNRREINRFCQHLNTNHCTKSLYAAQTTQMFKTKTKDYKEQRYCQRMIL